MLPLGVRNRLAELILAAFDEPAARETLEALAAFCRDADGRVGDAGAARLSTLGWFTRAGEDRVVLQGALRPYRAALCGRAEAAAAMLGGVADVPDATSLAGLLGRAALLADAGLFFEVHELLEPAWMRADGLSRVGLQGLIQVAVARHHATNGNREGAISLLREGLAKLAAARGALPVDTVAWEGALAALLAALQDGVPPPASLTWPRPTEAAWRSS